jgi:hypothetical protein
MRPNRGAVPVACAAPRRRGSLDRSGGLNLVFTFEDPDRDRPDSIPVHCLISRGQPNPFRLSRFGPWQRPFADIND